MYNNDNDDDETGISSFQLQYNFCMNPIEFGSWKCKIVNCTDFIWGIPRDIFRKINLFAYSLPKMYSKIFNLSFKMNLENSIFHTIFAVKGFIIAITP